jgi:transaldolase
MKIYLDGAALNDIKLYKKKIDGFTYNPTLISKFKKKNYISYCREIAKKTYPMPVSLEVIADDTEGMIRQAKILNALSKNIEIKIPITFTSGEYTKKVLKELVNLNMKLNVTAIFNLQQIKKIHNIIKNTRTILSVFAGRIHDTGISAEKEMSNINIFLKKNKSKCRLLWASTRQIYDYVQAKRSGCNIITMSKEIFNKKSHFKLHWKRHSLLTVKQFYQDAKKSGFRI